MRPSHLLAAVAVLLATVALAADDKALVSEATATVATFKKTDPKIEKFFNSAAGYAVFPTIAKGAVVVGGAGGDGVLFEGGKPVGKSSMGQASIGFQLGGQTYSEVVFFETPSSLSDFKKGNFALAAQASAVALSAGPAANAKYERAWRSSPPPRAASCTRRAWAARSSGTNRSARRRSDLSQSPRGIARI